MTLFRFVKKVFFLGLTILSNFTNALSVTPLNFISMKNQECKVRPEIININPFHSSVTFLYTWKTLVF